MIGDNPNRVAASHFKKALELAEKCVPEDKEKPTPKVGAVLVKRGEIIRAAYRGQERDSGAHAEFLVLTNDNNGQPIINPDAFGADLISTLEPCSKRSPRKTPCAKWACDAGIRKVWIGTVDLNPDIRGEGYEILLRNGVLVGGFPDRDARPAYKMNKRFFDDLARRSIFLQRTRATKEKRRLIRDIKKRLENRRKSKDKKGISKFETTLNYLIYMDSSKAVNWPALGYLLDQLDLLELAQQAFLLATSIDSTLIDAWYGLAKIEHKMNRKRENWPLDKTPKRDDKKTNGLRSNAYYELARENTSVPEKIRLSLRAIQLGKRDDEIWVFLTELMDVDVAKLSHDERFIGEDYWNKIGDIFSDLYEEEKEIKCLSEASKYHV